MVTQNHFVIPATVLEKFRSRGFPEGVTLAADHCMTFGSMSYLNHLRMCDTLSHSPGFDIYFLSNMPRSAEQSSAYCHYFLFFGRHNHSISTPRGEYGQYQPLGVNTGKYSTFFSVLWHQKTWNNDLDDQENKRFCVITMETSRCCVAVYRT